MIMDNQHKQIKGYRDLSQEEINLMNEIKALAEEVGVLVDGIHKKIMKECENLGSGENGEIYQEDFDAYCDAFDWVTSAKKDLQLGFMQLTRAVAKPTTF